jgi:endonuclease YncB( thermonuclease family)
MKTLTKSASLLALIVICALSGAAQQAASAPVQQRSISVSTLPLIEGKVINVHDGDTVTVLDSNNKKIHIRLQGIDAPELKQEYGSDSQQNLSRLVFGKQVTIVWTKLDKYRRTVGTIMLDGQDMNIEQVKAGLAWHFKKYEDEQAPADRATYAAAELQARAAKLGLWKDANPTAPGDWRQDVKTKRWGPPPPEGTIIGNSNSKKYHRPDCPGYRDMAERNRIFFKSVAEAESAGYKRAGNCPPEDQAVILQKTAATQTPTLAPSTAPPSTTKPSSTSPSLPMQATIEADPKPLPAKVESSSSTANTGSSTGQIIGNKNSKIFHTPGCSTYNSVSEKNRVYFNTAEEAEKAGYRKAKTCH